MKFNKTLFIALAIAVFIGLPEVASAQGLLPACATDVKAVLQLSCFLNLLISVSNFILGITGSLALLFFVYGGFLFLISHGNPEQITKGKTILTQATIGIIIIFGAYLAVNFLVANVLKAKFTTEIPQEAAPAGAPPPTAPTTPTTPKSVACACSACTDGFVPKVSTDSAALCPAACSSACGVHSKISAPLSCNCVCDNNKSGIVKDISATPDKKNLILNCAAFCGLNGSIMKSCD